MVAKLLLFLYDTGANSRGIVSETGDIPSSVELKALSEILLDCFAPEIYLIIWEILLGNLCM